MASVKDLIDKFQELSIERPITPKGKRTAYNFFSKDHMAKMKSKGEAFNLGQMSKVCGKAWKEMSDKQKTKYQKMAAEDAQRYEDQWNDYERQKREFDQKLDHIHDKGGLSHLETTKKSKKDKKRLSIFVTKNVLEKLEHLDDDDDSEASEDDTMEDFANLTKDKNGNDKYKVKDTEEDEKKDEEEEEEDEEEEEEDEEEEDEEEDEEEEEEEEDGEEDDETLEEEENAEEDGDDEDTEEIVVENEEESEESDSEEDKRNKKRPIRAKVVKRLFNK